MGWREFVEKAVCWGSLALGVGDKDILGEASGVQGSNCGDLAL